MANDEGTPPEPGDAGAPADAEEPVAVEPPTSEELDQLDAAMTADRKPMGPEDDEQTAVAENEQPSDEPPTSVA